MSAAFEFNYPLYLRSKVTVDDRALHQPTFDKVVENIIDSISDEENEQDSCYLIVEIGGGIGAMADRLLKRVEEELRRRHIAPRRRLFYMLVDEREDNIEMAKDYLMEKGLIGEPRGQGAAPRLRQCNVLLPRLREMGSAVALVAGDGLSDLVELLDFVRSREEQEDLPKTADLLITAAFLDLIDVRQTLPKLLSHTRPQGGLFYAPINFDAATEFVHVETDDKTLDLPTLNDRDICHRIEALYHKQLDVHNLQINGIGDCRSGRKVITELLRLQKTCSLVSAGSSSWIVAPTDEGKYCASEKYFVRSILSIMQKMLLLPEAVVDSESERVFLDEVARLWLREANQALDADCLVYIAHNIDVLAMHKPKD